jgi:hypothetical protein
MGLDSGQQRQQQQAEQGRQQRQQARPTNVSTADGAPSVDNTIVERRLNQTRQAVESQTRFDAKDVQYRVTDSGTVEVTGLSERGQREVSEQQSRVEAGLGFERDGDGNVRAPNAAGSETLAEQRASEERTRVMDGLGFEVSSADGEVRAPDAPGSDTLREQQAEEQLANIEEGLGFERDGEGNVRPPDAPGNKTIREQQTEDRLDNALEGIGYERDGEGNLQAPDAAGSTPLVEQEELGDSDWTIPRNVPVVGGTDVEQTFDRNAKAYSETLAGAADFVADKAIVDGEGDPIGEHAKDIGINPAVLPGSKAYAETGATSLAYGGKNLGEFLNIPGYASTAIEATEWGEFFLDDPVAGSKKTASVGKEYGEQFVEYSQENPGKALGMGIAAGVSIPASQAALSGLAARSPRAATAAGAVLDPGYATFKAGRAGIRSVRAADAPDVVSGAAARARSAGSDISAKTPDTRIDKDPNAGLMEIDPEVKQQLRQATFGRGANAIDSGIETARSVPSRGRDVVGDLDAEQIGRAARREAARLQSAGRQAGDAAREGIDTFMQRVESGPTQAGDVARQQAFLRGSSLPSVRGNNNLSPKFRNQMREVGDQIDRFMSRTESGGPGSGDVALQQAFLRNSAPPSPDAPSAQPYLDAVQSRAGSAVESVDDFGRRFATQSPSVTGDVGLQQAFLRGSDFPTPDTSGFSDVYRVSRDRAGDLADSMDDIGREVALRSPMDRSDLIQQQAFLRGSDVRKPSMPGMDFSNIRQAARRELTAARFGISETASSARERFSGLSDLTVRVGGRDPYMTPDIDEPAAIRSPDENPLGIDSDTDIFTETDSSPVSRSDSVESSRGRDTTQENGRQQTAADSQSASSMYAERTGTGTDSTRRSGEFDGVDPIFRVEAEAGGLFGVDSPDPTAAPTDAGQFTDAFNRESARVEQPQRLEFEPRQVERPQGAQLFETDVGLNQELGLDSGVDTGFETDVRPRTRVDVEQAWESALNTELRVESGTESGREAFYPMDANESREDSQFFGGGDSNEWHNPIARLGTGEAPNLDDIFGV